MEDLIKFEQAKDDTILGKKFTVAAYAVAHVLSMYSKASVS
ncbi:hypothetical protein FDUTEX481_05699 [Tolypothrix sp. PCC 7601]|nr:hypothetical protein FDUTEX481_05699 [Tolypothrix sp. PCC 7601]